MGLHIGADHLVGRELAKLHGGRRRQDARIGGEEIASRGQHIATAARRRAGRSGFHALAIERREQRLALGSGASLPGGIVAMRRAPIDMQPVLDGEVLQIAKPGVDLLQRVLIAVGVGDTGLSGKPRALRSIDDELGETLAPPAVEPVGDGIFVHEPLQLLRCARYLGLRQRRR